MSSFRCCATYGKPGCLPDETRFIATTALCVMPRRSLTRSGMLPGWLAGYYSFSQVQVNLAKLTEFAQGRIIAATATGIDIASKQLHVEGRPPLPYDVLSLDVGITPESKVRHLRCVQLAVSVKSVSQQFTW